MFNEFEVLEIWKLSWDLSFLFLGVSDGHIFFDFSNYCPYCIGHSWNSFLWCGLPCDYSNFQIDQMNPRILIKMHLFPTLWEQMPRHFTMGLGWIGKIQHHGICPTHSWKSVKFSTDKNSRKEIAQKQIFEICLKITWNTIKTCLTTPEACNVSIHPSYM